MPAGCFSPEVHKESWQASLLMIAIGYNAGKAFTAQMAHSWKLN